MVHQVWMYFPKYLRFLHQITGEGFPVLHWIAAYVGSFVVDKFRKAIGTTAFVSHPFHNRGAFPAFPVLSGKGR